MKAISLLRWTLLLVLAAPLARAQNKQLSLEDAMLRARSSLAPQNLGQLQFYGSTNDYVYLKKEAGTDVWMRGSYQGKTDTAFLNLTQLNGVLRRAGSDTLVTMPPIRFTPDGWLFNAKGSKSLLNPVTGTLKTLLPKELAEKEHAEESKAGLVAYVEKHNLYVADGSKRMQLTKDGSTDLVYGGSVHRDEFGINKGIFWSPGGNRLAFYRMDQGMVTDYPLIDWTQTPAKASMIKYPMAGDKSHHVTIGVYHHTTGQVTWLKTGEPAEQYLTNIAWSPDDRSVYVAIVNRAQNHVWLNQYDAVTGEKIKTLFEETDLKYAEPLNPLQFVPGNPRQFIWQSNRDGWNHLYLYDTSGTLLRQMTRGNWEVTEVKGWDSKGEHLYFTATASAAVNRNLYRLHGKSGVISPVTPEPAVHSTQVSADGTMILDAWSSTQNPRTIQLLNLALTKKKKVQQPKLLLQAENPLKEYATGELSIFTIRNSNGDSLYARMYKPAGFQPGKKYPVIVYWYGGPHAQMILNSWNGGPGDYWFQYLAQREYLVFSIDTRGSDNRGRDFEQTIYRRLGQAQVDDLLSAVDYLKQLPYADTDRMGLFGWSFGGFLTTHFLLQHPGVFKAGVAGGPVMDWRYYEIMYGERYMDTPQENPEGYAYSNLIRQAGKLKDKLLILHGLQDPVVVQQHSVNFVKAAVDAGVQVDYMIYPGHEHNVLGKDRVHLYQKVTDYLLEKLK